MTCHCLIELVEAGAGAVQLDDVLDQAPSATQFTMMEQDPGIYLQRTDTILPPSSPHTRFRVAQNSSSRGRRKMNPDEDESYWENVPSYTEEDLRAAEILGSLNAGNSSTVNFTDEPPARRKPGRPKGSLNKNKKHRDTGDSAGGPKPLGRPRGTGPRQLERAAGTAPPEQPKRPVGRPRVHFSPPPATIRLGRTHVPGVPPPLRPGDHSNTLRMSGGRLLGSNPETSTSTKESSSLDTRPPRTSAVPPSSDLDESNIIFLDEDDDEYAGLLNDGVGDDRGDGDSDGEDEPDPGAAGEDDSEVPEAPKKRTGGPAHPLPKWLMDRFDVHVAASASACFPLYFFSGIRRRFFRKASPVLSADINSIDTALFHVPGDVLILIVLFGSLATAIAVRSVSILYLENELLPFGAGTPEFLMFFLAGLLAISESLFMFMRSCFQSGMGAKQFSDALRVKHLEQYDKLQLSYLWKIAESQGLARWRQKKFRAFKSFEDSSLDGYHGFIPSSQWLRDLFDTFMERRAPCLDQVMAMLSAEINAIDHSFKLAKHVAKVDGEQIFVALLTVTNHKGEIRVCNLVATKSHSQFELALTRMRHSLEIYGHSQPILFYTDNMGDKDFLERCFPSLRQGVVPVEKYSHLPALEIPGDIGVCVLKSLHEIDEAMRTILMDIPEDDNTRKITIFVDSEWNVETSQHGYVTGRGQTAILQIAYKNMIYILQLGAMLAGIALHVELGIDKWGLMLYQHRRGTNYTEGGVHTHLRSRLPTSGVSVRHVNSCLKDFVLRHNLLVGTFNSTGKRYKGHYSIWIINEVQELISSLEDCLIEPILLTGWVNGNLYVPTKEVAGVLPIPDDVRLKSGMAQFEQSLHSKQRHRYLAALQGTRKPVLPIHSTPEKHLFRELMATNPSNFSTPANIDKLLSEQLKVYFNGDWKTNANIIQSKAMTTDVRAPLNNRLHALHGFLQHRRSR
ncbi:hypothetical protein B0H12DRAFT_1235640 [Mycena haematopus]|nr:hypothetical protein B0H12DRAFT_1235640 [Mycena haematopus]